MRCAGRRAQPSYSLAMLLPCCLSDVFSCLFSSPLTAIVAAGNGEPACSRARRCLVMAGGLMGNGSTSPFTDARPAHGAR